MHEGDKPSHEVQLWASCTLQERGGGRGGIWSTPISSDIMLRSTKIQWFHWEPEARAIERQQSTTCFYFVQALTVTMFFWFTWPHGVKILYSTGCSPVRSGARAPIALQVGTSWPSLGTTWELPFIYRLRTNCYSPARTLTRQRYVLCPLSVVRAFLST